MPSAPPPRCTHHPFTLATWHCEKCNLWLCKKCLTPGSGAPVCDSCGTPCTPVALPPPVAGPAPAPRPPLPSDAPPVEAAPSRDRKGAGRLPARTAQDMPCAAVEALAAAPAAQAAPAESAPVVPPEAVSPAPPAAQAPRPPPPPAARRAPPARPCDAHPGEAATRRCDACGRFICPTCIKEAHKGLAWAACAGHVRRLTRQEAGLPPQAFFSELPFAFIYPFKGSGKWMLAVGAVMLGLGPYGGPVGQAVAVAYCCAYLVSILQCSANSESEPPSFPSLTQFVQNIGAPVFYFAVAAVVSFAPALIFGLFVMPRMFAEPVAVSGDLDYDARFQQVMQEAELAGDSLSQDDLSARVRAIYEQPEEEPSLMPFEGPLLGVLLLLALIGAGIFYLPMGLIAVALHQTVAPLNPVFIIPSILRVFPQYVIVFIVMLVAAGVELTAKAMAFFVPGFGPFFVALVSLFFLMADMRLLGVLYDANQERLAWFA